MQINTAVSARSATQRPPGWFQQPVEAEVIERILKHLNAWGRMPGTISGAGPDPPLPDGESLPLTYHPVPNIA